MFGKKLLVPAALVALSLTGCVVTGTLTPTGTAGSQTGSPAPTAGNKDLSGKAVTEVMINGGSTMVIQAKKAAKVMATVKYADGSSDSNVALSSDDATIVAVNGTNGEISGVKPGVTTVRATAIADSNKFALVTVTVKEGEVVDVLATIEPETATLAKKGQTVQLSAFLQTSAGKSSPNGNWKSSNSLVAIVNDEGLVTAVGNGTATITFTSDEKSTVKATANITVGDAPAAAPTPAPVKETTSTTTVTTETSTTTK